MAKPQIKVVNAQTGEEIIRDATAAEIAQMELDAQQSAIEKTQAEAKAAAKAAILNRIGLTVDELKTILS